MAENEEKEKDISAGPSSRKEKKKQAKEERDKLRDKLKQAEKKKRRLEKALATAAAIRSELETKKERKKEEEVRLDEEGAALAEAVALRVLVDEESDGVENFPTGRSTEAEPPDARPDAALHLKRPLGNVNERALEDGNSGRGDSASSPTMELENVESNALKVPDDAELVVKWKWRNRKLEQEDEGPDQDGDLVPAGDRSGMATNCTEESLRERTEWARAAEVAAGLAASKALAALQIAEEARAEAEAAKKAVEDALSLRENRDKQDSPAHTTCRDLLGNSNGMAAGNPVDLEKEELWAQLEESQRKLRLKSRRVLELEHDLEEMTRHLQNLKSQIPHNPGDHDGSISAGHKKDSATNGTSSAAEG